MSKQGNNRANTIRISGEPNRLEVDTLMRAFGFVAPTRLPFSRQFIIAQAERLSVEGTKHDQVTSRSLRQGLL